MIKLASIGFINREGKRLLFDIPKEMQIEFNYKFGTVREEVMFAGGMILAAPKDDMKVLLTCESKHEERLILETLYFKVEGERLLQEFDIPRKMAISFQKMGWSDKQAVDFAGTVFVRLIAKELQF